MKRPWHTRTEKVAPSQQLPLENFNWRVRDGAHGYGRGGTPTWVSDTRGTSRKGTDGAQTRRGHPDDLNPPKCFGHGITAN